MTEAAMTANSVNEKDYTVQATRVMVGDVVGGAGAAVVCGIASVVAYVVTGVPKAISYVRNGKPFDYNASAIGYLAGEALSTPAVWAFRHIGLVPGHLIGLATKGVRSQLRSSYQDNGAYIPVRRAESIFAMKALPGPTTPF